MQSEAGAEHRFDPNLAGQLLLDIAHEQSMETLVEKLVTSTVSRPDAACIQIWLLEKGDRCPACRFQRRCLEPGRGCLHLVAARGRPLAEPGSVTSRFGAREHRLPLGEGLVGEVAATGELEVARGKLAREAAESLGIDWIEQERIEFIGGCPIMFKGEVLGVIVAFLREEAPAETRLWGRIFGEHIGAAIANARAFGEIQRLKAQLELQNTYLQEEVIEAKAFGDLVGQSGALRQIVSQIDLVAPTDASVLVLGETGTGKELVAREIHRRSPRHEAPLVRINCPSIPRELFESEFFGHVRGAFTGAIKERVGRFEAADGGTLFLDEIGDLPLEMQGKLLRVLQEKRYERVGEDQTRYADVRVIGATNRDLKKAVAAGAFREDLYYRLHVFPIQVAPLRERREDIPLLAGHFVELSVKGLKCPAPRLTRAAVAKLQAYHWPGNVRELRNVIERAVILAQGATLEFDLPVTATAAAKGPPKGNPKPEPEFLTQAELEQRERENLLVILRKTNGRIKGPDGAAELLGVKATTLFSRLRRMGLRGASAELK